MDKPSHAAITRDRRLGLIVCVIGCGLFWTALFAAVRFLV